MFAKRLKELRQEKNLSQIMLAMRIGSNQKQISKWENGIIEPNLEQLKSLATEFQVSVDYLIGLSQYGSEIVEIQGEKLDENEKMILENYRSLDVDARKSFVEMSESIARAHGSKAAKIG